MKLILKIFGVSVALLNAAGIQSAAYASNLRMIHILSRDPNQMLLIRVSENMDTTYTFESCLRTGPGSVTATQCSLLGDRQKYSFSELRNKRIALMTKGVTAAAFDSAIIAVPAFYGLVYGTVGLAALSEVIPWMPIPFYLYPAVGAGAGGSIGGSIVNIADALDVRSRFRKAKAIKEIIFSEYGDIYEDDISTLSNELANVLKD